MVFPIIITIIAFGIMVTLHEAGHFFVAKRCGVMVHEFSIGMGPLIFKWGKGETQYSLRLLPLGGYVKLEGEGEESDDPKAFSNVSPLKRIGILVAGAIMNILLGFICFVIINNVSNVVYSNRIYDVVENSAAYEAGMMAGDRIVKLNNTRIDTYSDIRMFMMSPTEEIKVTYKRDGVKNTVTLSPSPDENGNMKIGFYPDVEELNFIESVQYACYDTKYVVKAVLMSLKMLFTGEAKVSDMSGPVGVVQVVDRVTEESSQYGATALIVMLLNLFGMISVNLGVFNLLPIPALDGGSIIFAFVELVSRKKLKQEVLGYINLIGLVLIMGLGIFVMFSDVMKIIN